jgi:hypothetical protein
MKTIYKILYPIDNSDLENHKAQLINIVYSNAFYNFFELDSDKTYLQKFNQNLYELYVLCKSLCNARPNYGCFCSDYILDQLNNLCKYNLVYETYNNEILLKVRRFFAYLSQSISMENIQLYKLIKMYVNNNEYEQAKKFLEAYQKSYELFDNYVYFKRILKMNKLLGNVNQFNYLLNIFNEISNIDNKDKKILNLKCELWNIELLKNIEKNTSETLKSLREFIEQHKM